jgi:hypothetical protein
MSSGLTHHARFSPSAEYRLLGDLCADLCRAGAAGVWRANESPDAFLREGVEDQLILEQAKGPEGMSREQIESRIVVPRHTIFLQIFPLYILPVIIIVAGYFFFSLLGFL